MEITYDSIAHLPSLSHDYDMTVTERQAGTGLDQFPMFPCNQDGAAARPEFKLLVIQVCRFTNTVIGYCIYNVST